MKIKVSYVFEVEDDNLNTLQYRLRTLDNAIALAAHGTPFTKTEEEENDD
jgi:hypothetical protein